MKTTGVVIGRFQLPELHNGHKAFLNHVLQNNDTTCVLVGVAQRVTAKNLLPFPAVAQMIRGTFPREYAEAQLFVFPLADHPGDNGKWSSHIDVMLRMLFPKDSIRLYAGRDSFKPAYEGALPVLDWFGYDGNINGSKVRERIFTGDPIDSKDFRSGIIYGIGNLLRQLEDY